MDTTGLVFCAGPAGGCDDFRVGGATVDYDAVTGKWRMWYYCRDRNFDGPPMFGTGRIGLAISTDGVQWVRVQGDAPLGSVFAPSDQFGDFDSLHVGLTDVTRDAGGWLMWYFGGSHEQRTSLSLAIGTVAGLGLRCGVARSTDGITWERLRGNEPSGALFDYASDTLYAGWPNAFWDGVRYVLQYTAPELDISHYATQVMTSVDAINWLPAGEIRWAGELREYEKEGIVTRQVLQNPLPGGRRFLMIYTALDGHHARSIAAADSDDGLLWHQLYDEPIFRVGTKGAWDDLGVAANRLVVAGGQLYFYYYGFQTLANEEGMRGIGLATCPIGDLRSLERYAITKSQFAAGSRKSS
ncbi:MAG: hypothetical protein ACI87W_000931 [Halieaceae bacterium]|jgi:hypothetical protein